MIISSSQLKFPSCQSIPCYCCMKVHYRLSWVSLNVVVWFAHMELFNTGLVSVLLLKAYSKSLFPDRMTPGQNKKKKKKVCFLDKAGISLLFILHPDLYHPGEFSMLGDSPGSLLIQIYFFLSSDQFSRAPAGDRPFLKALIFAHSFWVSVGKLETLRERQ